LEIRTNRRVMALRKAGVDEGRGGGVAGSSETSQDEEVMQKL
jgi:hypothetical protein